MSKVQCLGIGTLWFHQGARRGPPRDLLHEFAREITIIDNLLTWLTANSTIVLEWIDT